MHFFFITRGIKQQRDLMVKFLETHLWKWKRKDLKTGKDVMQQVQGNLQPLELWSYNIPEECMDEFLSAFLNEDNTFKLGKLRQKALCKALGKGVKPIKSYNKVPTNKYIETRGVAIYPIGIKNDSRKEMKQWGYEQEML